MRISDFKGIFKKSEITLINKENTGLDYWQFDFKIDKGYDWEAGEHGAFIIKKPKIKGKSFRAFSVASIPEEGFLRIITRTGKNVSNFKQALLDFEKGAKMTLIGPFGWFKLPSKPAPIIIIVGGVGFAPARALLKRLENEPCYPTKLLYISNDIYLCKEEIAKIADSNNVIEVSYFSDKDILMNNIKEITSTYGNDAYYYISGSPTMIKGIKKSLKSFGIKRNRQVSDPFFGY
jgi:NAD(P)H-flavin reductase